MAKTWSLSEAVTAILSGDKDSIRDLAGRYPVTSVTIAKMGGDNDAALTLLTALPDYISMRKMEGLLKGEEITIEPEEEPEEEETTEEKKEKRNARDRKNYRKVKDKQEQKEEEPEEEPEEEAAEDQEIKVPDYSNTKVTELYKMCQERGIKVKPRQDRTVYIELLKKADEEAAKKVEEEADDWGEEEDEEPEPQKKTRGRKAAKQAPPEDDEDWDV